MRELTHFGHEAVKIFLRGALPRTPPPLTMNPVALATVVATPGEWCLVVGAKILKRHCENRSNPLLNHQFFWGGSPPPEPPLPRQGGTRSRGCRAAVGRRAQRLRRRTSTTI